jgi:hypothetical protein
MGHLAAVQTSTVEVRLAYSYYQVNSLGQILYRTLQWRPVQLSLSNGLVSAASLGTALTKDPGFFDSAEIPLWSPDGDKLIYRYTTCEVYLPTCQYSQTFTWTYAADPAFSSLYDNGLTNHFIGLRTGPGWRHQFASVQRTCSATINANPDFPIRSSPNRSSNIIGTRLPNGTPLTILGLTRVEDWTWYRVEYGQVVGWSRRDGINEGVDCIDIPLLDASANPLPVSVYDVPLPPPPQGWLSIPCSESTQPTYAQDEINWGNCSKRVYARWYPLFVEQIRRTPQLSDLIAAVYTNELADLISGNPPTGIHGQIGVEATEIAIIAIRSNFWSIFRNVPIITIESLMEDYMYQVQSWYQLALLAPDGVLASELITDPSNYRLIGRDTLSQQWPVTVNTPRNWANIPYGNAGYDSLYSNPQVVYCTTFQEYIDSDKSEDVSSGDRWTDYRFAIITGTTLGGGYVRGTYNQATSPRPLWLDNDTARNAVATNRFSACGS